MKKQIIITVIFIVTQIGCLTDLVKKNDVAYLLREGNFNYAKENYLDAEKVYKSILDGFPNSPYRLNALMGMADSLFRQEKYMEASWSYREFYDLYPAHKDTVKARFYRGVSSFIERGTYDRDQTNTNKALKQFEEIVTNPEFKKSIFYEESISKIKECRALLAHNMFFIGLYYFKMKSYWGAINRMENVIAEFPDQPFEGEAIYIIAESYFRENNYYQAAKYFDRIIEKFPLSIYAGKTNKRLAEIKKAGNRLEPVQR